MENTENTLNKSGYDPKNRLVTLTVTDTETIVTKEGCNLFNRHCDTYEEAEEYFEFLVSDSQN